LVIGAGGLGCPVLQNLVAAGVGTLGIVDGDTVDITNLHRQLLYTLEDCGKSKAQTAAKKVKALNPEVKVEVFDFFLDANTIFDCVNNYQIIVDCTDTIAIRYLINDVAVYKKTPVVYASIFKFEGQVSVFNYKNGPSYRCLFPEKENVEQMPNCAVSGVLGVLPNTLGAFQATEVLKIILGIGELLSGKLMIYDALHCQSQYIAFAKNPKAIEKSYINGSQIFNQKKTNESLSEILFLEKSKQPNILLIDLREANELPVFEAENKTQLSLNKLEESCKSWDKNQEIIVFCQTGQRSQIALNFLKKKGFIAVFHLERGIQFIEKNTVQL
jgi:adenylyltransferase/sulfurtransferase